MMFQLILRWFAYGSPRFVFLRQKLNKMKYNPFFFFCLDDADTKNKKMDTNTEKPKGTLKKTKITEGYDPLFRSLALIPTDANLLITWLGNPQSRLRSDLGKPK
jgi:hypothetical protein